MKHSGLTARTFAILARTAAIELEVASVIVDAASSWWIPANLPAWQGRRLLWFPIELRAQCFLSLAGWGWPPCVGFFHRSVRYLFVCPICYKPIARRSGVEKVQLSAPVLDSPPQFSYETP